MALTTQFIRLQITGVPYGDGGDDGDIYCIKDFPDIDVTGNPDQVEVTTLCDEYHQFINGLKNHPEDLEFTANYNAMIFGKLNGNGILDYDPTDTYSVGDVVRYDGILWTCSTAIVTPEAWDETHWSPTKISILICSGASDYTGANGKFEIKKADVSVKLSGAGVGDVLEMIYVIKVKGDISFSAI